MGETLPVFKPPLDMSDMFGEPQIGKSGCSGSRCVT